GDAPRREAFGERRRSPLQHRERQATAADPGKVAIRRRRRLLEEAGQEAVVGGGQARRGTGFRHLAENQPRALRRAARAAKKARIAACGSPDANASAWYAAPFSNASSKAACVTWRKRALVRRMAIAGFAAIIAATSRVLAMTSLALRSRKWM